MNKEYKFNCVFALIVGAAMLGVGIDIKSCFLWITGTVSMLVGVGGLFFGYLGK